MIREISDRGWIIRFQVKGIMAIGIKNAELQGAIGLARDGLTAAHQANRAV